MRRWPLVVLAAAVLALGVLVWLSIRDVAPPDVAIQPRDARPPPLVEPLPPEPPAIDLPDAAVEEEGRVRPPDEPRRSHVFDSCLTPLDRPIPSDLEDITSRGITVAWPGEMSPETPFHPTVVAATVRGILDEAAEFTGLSPREKLTVIVYPDLRTYLQRTRAPAWSGGFYDGSAIVVPASSIADVSVEMRTLRHELMHAHLHLGVGCMPGWFNEGMAMLFAERAPVRELLDLLRVGDQLDPAVDTPTYEGLDDAHADHAYAQSLARMLYVAGHGGDKAIRDLVQTMRAASKHGRATLPAAWDTAFPHVDQHAIADWMAHRILDAALGPELEAAVHGPLCCTGTRNVRNLSCHPTARGTQSLWLEKPSYAVCRNQW